LIQKTKILILGGGFGGVRSALELSKSHLPNVDVALIDQHKFHEFHADFYEVAAAFLPEGESKPQTALQFENLAGSVMVPFEEIFKGKNVEVVVDKVDHINLKDRFVILEKGGKRDFDILIIALGSTTNYFGMKNLEEVALPLKTVGDALNIRNSVDELFVQKKPNKPINVVVGGGGFTGVEVAGELVRYLKTLAKLHNHPIELIDLSVIEACPTLLNGSKPWYQAEALRRLQKLGVNVHLDSKITQLTDHKIRLENGQVYDFDLLIWTAGIRANPLVESLEGVKLEKGACLAVNRSLQVVGFEGVFAIGDNSFCYDYQRSCVVPPTAQLAISQGKYIARAIRSISGGKKIDEFQPKLPNFIVPIGKGFALGEFLGLRFSGMPAWWMKRVVALKYFLSILPFLTALKLWFKGVRFFVS